MPGTVLKLFPKGHESKASLVLWLSLIVFFSYHSVAIGKQPFLKKSDSWKTKKPSPMIQVLPLVSTFLIWSRFWFGCLFFFFSFFLSCKLEPLGVRSNYFHIFLNLFIKHRKSILWLKDFRNRNFYLMMEPYFWATLGWVNLPNYFIYIYMLECYFKGSKESLFYVLNNKTKIRPSIICITNT